MSKKSLTSPKPRGRLRGKGGDPAPYGKLVKNVGLPKPDWTPADLPDSPDDWIRLKAQLEMFDDVPDIEYRTMLDRMGHRLISFRAGRGDMANRVRELEKMVDSMVDDLNYGEDEDAPAPPE